MEVKHIKPIDQVDIDELKRKIAAYKNGHIQEDRFKHYRLTRGVYGQRQLGVHMFRTKIPFGHLTSQQLIALADASEKYTNGNLHLTTRQNIQMHYVKLDDAVAIWEDLAAAGVTAREACGNTVRNITASATAGIDPDEPFDVSPYVHTLFEYFLRNPICQEMGRKIKIAFSSNEQDSAFAYFHDFGFIPRVRTINNQEHRGFKVLLAGGLGAIAMVAHTVYEFLEEELLIPFVEATIRVFDRYGEREKRQKARMKFLVKKLGFATLLNLIQEELKALEKQRIPIEDNLKIDLNLPNLTAIPTEKPSNLAQYNLWKSANTFEQKQKGWYAAQLRIPLGDIDAETARLLAKIIQTYAANDLRLTINQGILLKYIPQSHLPNVFNALQAIGLAQPGFDTTVDITACPGTDTCNLGVTNSTALATELSNLITKEYKHLIKDNTIKIKISGCMNSCGQHMAANIGLHGSSIKKNNLVIPAMQVVLGGGVDPTGKGFIAEKVIKLPSKKIPEALRIILNEYEQQAKDGAYFNDYFYQKGKRYFYNLLKPLANLDQLKDDDLLDWGEDSTYQQAIGVGECAGVSYDVIGTILQDAKEKLDLGKITIEKSLHADSIYHSYSTFVIAAKALLLSKDIKCNTHIGILDDFNKHLASNPLFSIPHQDFIAHVLRFKKEEPSSVFAQQYWQDAQLFFKQVLEFRTEQLDTDKSVVSDYYKA